MDREAAARASFAEQAAYCTQLAAPFTAMLCTLLGERLDRSTRIGRSVLDWPGDPAPIGDAHLQRSLNQRIQTCSVGDSFGFCAEPAPAWPPR